MNPQQATAPAYTDDDGLKLHTLMTELLSMSPWTDCHRRALRPSQHPTLAYAGDGDPPAGSCSNVDICVGAGTDGNGGGSGSSSSGGSSGTGSGGGKGDGMCKLTDDTEIPARRATSTTPRAHSRHLRPQPHHSRPAPQLRPRRPLLHRRTTRPHDRHDRARHPVHPLRRRRSRPGRAHPGAEVRLQLIPVAARHPHRARTSVGRRPDPMIRMHTEGLLR